MEPKVVRLGCGDEPGELPHGEASTDCSGSFIGEL
jgi:hypothetical protein